MSTYGFLRVCLIWSVLNSLSVSINGFHPVWGVFGDYFFKHSFCCFLPCPSGTSTLCMWAHFMVFPVLWGSVCFSVLLFSPSMPQTEESDWPVKFANSSLCLLESTVVPLWYNFLNFSYYTFELQNFGWVLFNNFISQNIILSLYWYSLCGETFPYSPYSLFGETKEIIIIF